MANFTTFIVDMIKNEKLLAPQGGPIILAQVSFLCPLKSKYQEL